MEWKEREGIHKGWVSGREEWKDSLVGVVVVYGGYMKIHHSGFFLRDSFVSCKKVYLQGTYVRLGTPSATATYRYVRLTQR